jgi:hypothetical protein
MIHGQDAYTTHITIDRFRQQAAHCRRLAQGAVPLTVMQELSELAEVLERAARRQDRLAGAAGRQPAER